MRRETYNEFRHLCRRHSLAATHQRQKIYEALVSRPGHYSPEEIYAQVKQHLPSISLATVYKNLKIFVQAGMLRDVSPHHGSWRVDANTSPHHHLVCIHCHSITDLDIDLLEPVKLQGFGTFALRTKRERLGRNPKTGVEATICARRVISFHASPALIARVNGEPPRESSD